MEDIEKKQPLIERKSKKWPRMFWFLMRVLALFYHRNVVLERKCFSCRVGSVSSLKNGNTINGMDTTLDFHILSYESNINADGGGEMTKHLQYQGNNECDICQTLWWNSHMIPVKYTERDIGITKWGRKWNGVTSIVWLVVALSILLCYVGSFVPRLFGKADEILKLFIKLTLFALLVTHYVVVLCSKLRSFFQSEASRLCWATPLNVRYLIQRGQFLDMPTRGLPGRPFLVLCACCPVVLSTYRAVIWLYISNCEITFYSLIQTVTGVIFTINWGFSIYILYFIRVSFQCQFNLLVAYINEFQEDFKRCKAVILNVAADVVCYDQLCSLYLIVNLPTTILAVVANLTLAYTIKEGNCLDEKGQRIAHHFAILSWSEIAMAMIFSAMAMGGYKVRYLWENFVANVSIIRSKRSEVANKELFFDAEYALRASNVLLATILFSVTGIYMGFQFGDQNITMLNNSCNGTVVHNGCL